MLTLACLALAVFAPALVLFVLALIEVTARDLRRNRERREAARDYTRPTYHNSRHKNP